MLMADEINHDDARIQRLDPKPVGRRSRIKFVRTSTNDIMAMTFDPIRWVVPGYISDLRLRPNRTIFLSLSESGERS